MAGCPDFPVANQRQIRTFLQYSLSYISAFGSLLGHRTFLRRCPYRYEEKPLPNIHRRLGGLLSSRHRRIMVAGVAVPTLLLAVAACDGAASAAPAAATRPSPGSSPDPAGANAYFDCLRQHGVTGFGGGSSSGSSSSSSTVNKARQACASLRPSGGFGGSGGSSAALSKFESCLSAHGVTLPSPSASGGGFRGLFSELQSTTAGQAALNACKSDLPFTPGSGGTGGGGGSTSTGGGTTTTT